MARRGRPRHPDILTPREWEVLELLRERLTNEGIAARLAISPETAKFHVSEIISKLAVRDRHEAATWQPDAETRRSLLAAVPFVRRLHLGSVPPVASASVAIAAVLGISLLAWSVVTMRARDEGTRSAARGCASTITPTVGPALTVELTDVRTRSCRVLPLGDGLMKAQWLDPGQTIVAYDTHDRNYVILDLKGTVVRSIDSPVPQGSGGRIHAQVNPSPDGKTVVIERDVFHTVTVLDIASGQEHRLGDGSHADTDGGNDNRQGFLFSPDGQHLSYNTTDGDRTAVVIADADGANPHVIRSAAGGAYVNGIAWSPDGQRLLIVQARPDGNTWEVVGVDGTSVWSSSEDRLASASWVGSARLLVSQRFVDLATGTETVAPPRLAQVDTVSPDGQFATTANGDGTCSLIEIETLKTLVESAGCNAVWTPDSSEILSSFPGN